MLDILEAIITSARETTDSDLSVSAWKVDTGEKLNKYRGGGYCMRRGLALSGGYLLAADDKRPLVHAWMLNANQCGSAGQLLTSKPRCLDATKDIAYIAVGAEDSIQLYQMGTGRLVANVGKKFQPPTVIKFSSDDSLLACAASDGAITVWIVGVLLARGDVTEPLFVFEGHRLPVGDLEFTSGGLRSKLVSVSSDRTCKIHDLISGTLISSVIYNMGLTAVALHPNENHLFIGNKIGGIHVLALDLTRDPGDRHLTVEEQTCVFEGHSDEVTALACSSHRPIMASGSLDGSVKIWDILTSNCLRTLEHKGPVTNVLFELVSNAFDKSFKPQSLLPYHCVPYEIVTENKPEEVVTRMDLCRDSFDNSVAAADAGGVEEVVKEELAKLKSTNEALYMFSVKRILNKTVRFNTTQNDIEKSDIIEENKKKLKTKKKKKVTKKRKRKTANA